MDREELEEYRRQHPLAAIMPVIHKLLVLPSHDSGMLVAVGDEVGRLLWVEGDAAMQRRAEGMMFVPGADWSEATVGTSAPGTALALGRGIQISGAEHYKRSVHPWSCTAVPFHDPDSGALLGVVDITGTESAVAPHTLSLVEATVAAAQAHLRVERLQLAAARQSSPARRRSPAVPKAAHAPAANSLYRNSLQLLGRDQALLSIDGRTVALSARHSEILALLSTHPEGLNAEELCNLLYPGDASTMTLRAEMVRLRKVLQQLNPGAVPESRPYRLPLDLVPDCRAGPELPAARCPPDRPGNLPRRRPAPLRSPRHHRAAEPGFLPAPRSGADGRQRRVAPEVRRTSRGEGRRRDPDSRH